MATGRKAPASEVYALTPRADPLVRSDGLCAICLKPRKVTEQARKYAGPQLDLDPYCSSACARRWHGCELASVSTEGQAESGRAAAARIRAQSGFEDA